MNEMSEMNRRRVGVSPYESECEMSLSESPYQTECEMSLSKCPYQTECEMSLSESPYQKVPIKLSISKCPHQNINSTFYDSNCSSIGTRVSFNSTTYYQINHTH